MQRNAGKGKGGRHDKPLPSRPRTASVETETRPRRHHARFGRRHPQADPSESRLIRIRRDYIGYGSCFQSIPSLTPFLSLHYLTRSLQNMYVNTPHSTNTNYQQNKLDQHQN